MRKMICILSVLSLLASCAKEELQAPCPDFGRQCYKQPVNGWNYYEEA